MGRKAVLVVVLVVLIGLAYYFLYLTSAGLSLEQGTAHVETAFSTNGASISAGELVKGDKIAELSKADIASIQQDLENLEGKVSGTSTEKQFFSDMISIYSSYTTMLSKKIDADSAAADFANSTLDACSKTPLLEEVVSKTETFNSEAVSLKSKINSFKNTYSTTLVSKSHINENNFDLDSLNNGFENLQDDLTDLKNVCGVAV